MRWIALLLLLVVGPAHGQQYQCRTSPPGASTSYCASEAFVTDSVAASGGGVSSIAGNTGAFTLSTGITNSTNDIRLDLATNSNAWSATASKPVDAAILNSAGNIVALTDAATVALDMASFVNGSVTLGGNRTLGNPTNTQAGRTGCIFIVQDATGSRTLAYSSNWKFASAVAPTLTTTASAVDMLCYLVRTSTFIVGTMTKDVR